jgi:hypothetical protein
MLWADAKVIPANSAAVLSNSFFRIQRVPLIGGLMPVPPYILAHEENKQEHAQFRCWRNRCKPCAASCATQEMEQFILA